MKKLITELSEKDYPAEFDQYIGKKVSGKTIDGWEADYSPREGIVYWTKEYEDYHWTIMASAGYDYPPIQFMFDVTDETDDPIIQKQFKYKPTNFGKDFKLYMKYLKNMMKLANAKMK